MLSKAISSFKITSFYNIAFLQKLIITIVICILPLLFKDNYAFNLISTIGISVIMAMSLNMLFGFTGQISFAQAAFMGVGAYTSVILSNQLGVSFWLSILPSMALAGVIAFFVGLPVQKLRGHYLAIATLAVQLGLGVIFTYSTITGGTVGLFNIQRPFLFGINLANERAYAYVVIFGALITYFVVDNITNSKVGRYFKAIREDQLAAESLGINITYWKIVALILSASFSALAGVMYSRLILFVSPTSFSLDVSIRVLAMVVVGGLGSNLGAFLGAIVITLLPELLYGFGDFHFLVYGLLIILIMIFAPKGLAGVVNSFVLRVKAQRREKVA